MSMQGIIDFIQAANSVLISLIIFALGVGIIVVLALYFVDITQSKHALRRNFPVIGRFRY